jgi:hypothetical protein
MAGYRAKGVKLINVVYSAFSFLQKKLNRNHDQCYNVKQTVLKGSTVVDLIVAIGLKSEDVEAAFINGKVNRLSTPLNLEWDLPDLPARLSCCRKQYYGLHKLCLCVAPDSLVLLTWVWRKHTYSPTHDRRYRFVFMPWQFFCYVFLVYSTGFLLN